MQKLNNRSAKCYRQGSLCFSVNVKHFKLISFSRNCGAASVETNVWFYPDRVDKVIWLP